MSIFQELLDRPDIAGDRIGAAYVMAWQLMQDDPDECKAGYTLDNAMLVVRDGYELSGDEYTQVERRLVMRREKMFEVCGFMYPVGLATDSFVLSVSDGRTTVPLATNIQSLDVAQQLKAALAEWTGGKAKFIIERIGPCPVEVVE